MKLTEAKIKAPKVEFVKETPRWLIATSSDYHHLKGDDDKAKKKMHKCSGYWLQSTDTFSAIFQKQDYSI